MARVLRLDQSDTFYRMINLILSSGRPPRRRVGAVFLVLCSIMFCTRLVADSSQGHYFTRSELYERDRDLFRKYVPLCKRVAEAGWEPITQARSTSEHVHVERFGERYLTVFNGRAVPCTAGVILDGECPDTSLELVKGQAIKWQNHRVELSLDGEDVAVIQIR